MTADRALLGLAHLDVRGTRYVLGRTADVYALWDGAAGGPPVEEFPMSTEGWTRAWHRYRELETGGVQAPAAVPRAAPYPLTIGQIVGGGFRLWVRHFWPLAGMAAIPVIPASALTLSVSLSTMRVVRPPGGPVEIALPVWANILNNGVNAVAFALAAAAVVRAGVVALQGRNPSVGDAYRVAGRRTGTLLLVTLAGGLAAAAPLLPGMVLWNSGRSSGATLAAAVVLVAIGLVPAAFLTIRFLLWPGPAVVEGQRGLAPLRRSWRLVGGLFWRTLGAILLAGLVIFGAALVIFTLVFAVFIGTGGPVTESVLRAVVLVTGIASALLLTATLPFAEMVIALLYVDARVRKEALDLPTLARETGVGPPS
jgi:hypothetical protein